MFEISGLKFFSFFSPRIRNLEKQHQFPSISTPASDYMQIPRSMPYFQHSAFAVTIKIYFVLHWCSAATYFAWMLG